jgi:glycosyltransferase involved in cell wall biosynthesis
MRVTIAGINYAPETTGIAPYTTGLATGLRKKGHDVEVVTGIPHYPEWRVRPGYGGGRTADEIIDGVPVRRLTHYVPDPPGGLGRVRMEASFGARLALSLAAEPDVVLCVSPALLSTALCLARVRLRRSIFHPSTAGRRRPAFGVWVQDLYSRGVVETGALSGPGARLATAFESGVLRGADGVVAIHERFKSRMVAELGLSPERITVVRNWTHLEPYQLPDRAAVRQELGWPDDHVIVLHAGNMGAKQGLENVVDAAALSDTRSAPVRFVLLGDGNQRRQLEQRAANVRSLQFLRPLPDAEYRAALAAADILLVNERPGVGEMAVPSKITSYFTTGNPIIAATDARSITAAEITGSGGGVVIPPADPAALLEHALSLGADTELAHRLGRAGREFCGRNLSSDYAITLFDDWLYALAEGIRA